MITLHQEGRTIDHTPAALTPAGSLVFIADNFAGIAERTIAAGNLGAVAICGVYQFPKNTSEAFSMGDILFWDASTQTVTATLTAGNYIGRAAQAAATAAASCLVVLNAPTAGALTPPEK